MPCFRYLSANLQCDIVCIAARWGFAVLYDCNVMEPYDFSIKQALQSYTVCHKLFSRGQMRQMFHISANIGTAIRTSMNEYEVSATNKDFPHKH